MLTVGSIVSAVYKMHLPTLLFWQVAAVPLWTTPGALQATAAVQQTEPVQVSAVESRALRGLLSKPFKRAGLSNSLSQLLKASSATVQIAAADRSYKRNGKERRHSKDKRISGHRSKYFEGLSQSPSYTAPQQHHHTSAAQEAYQETMKRREPYDSTGRQPRPQQAPVQSQRPSAQPVRDEPRPQHDEQQEEPATSIGEIFRFSSAVDINYYGGATDTGHVDGSLAGVRAEPKCSFMAPAVQVLSVFLLTLGAAHWLSEACLAENNASGCSVTRTAVTGSSAAQF